MTGTERKLLVWTHRLAAAVGLACIVWVGIVSLQAALHDRQRRSQFEVQRTESATAAPRAIPVTAPEPATVAESDVSDISSDPIEIEDGLIGLLEIPRLAFSEIVAEGDDDDTLRLAIGHLPDTPLPWHPGNSALAGHRDGRFRPLKDIRIGDTIRLATRRGDLHYVLRETMIVMPDNVSVLEPTDKRTLTLITCYPFSYIGNAPKRFVMKAEALEGPVFQSAANR